MISPFQDLAAVVQRVERVEQQNQRLKGAGILVVLLGCVGLLMGQAQPRSRTVEAEAFVLRDAAGKARAGLEMAPDGAVTLALYDQAGAGRVAVRVKADGSPDVTLIDQAARARAVLRVEPAGSPGLVLFDDAGKPRATLYVVAEGSANLQLSDKNERVFWRVP
jgi:hypothetical protein